MPLHDPLYIDRRRLRNQAHGAVMLQVRAQSKRILEGKKAAWIGRSDINRYNKEDR